LVSPAGRRTTWSSRPPTRLIFQLRPRCDRCTGVVAASGRSKRSRSSAPLTAPPPSLPADLTAPASSSSAAGERGGPEPEPFPERGAQPSRHRPGLEADVGEQHHTRTASPARRRVSPRDERLCGDQGLSEPTFSDDVGRASSSSCGFMPINHARATWGLSTVSRSWSTW